MKSAKNNKILTELYYLFIDRGLEYSKDDTVQFEIFLHDLKEEIGEYQLRTALGEQKQFVIDLINKAKESSESYQQALLEFTANSNGRFVKKERNDLLHRSVYDSFSGESEYAKMFEEAIPLDYSYLFDHKYPKSSQSYYEHTSYGREGTQQTSSSSVDVKDYCVPPGLISPTNGRDPTPLSTLDPHEMLFEASEQMICYWCPRCNKFDCIDHGTKIENEVFRYYPKREELIYPTLNSLLSSQRQIEQMVEDECEEKMLTPQRKKKRTSKNQLSKNRRNDDEEDEKKRKVVTIGQYELKDEPDDRFSKLYTLLGEGENHHLKDPNSNFVDIYLLHLSIHDLLNASSHENENIPQGTSSSSNQEEGNDPLTTSQTLSRMEILNLEDYHEFIAKTCNKDKEKLATIFLLYQKFPLTEICEEYFLKKNSKEEEDEEEEGNEMKQENEEEEESTIEITKNQQEESHKQKIWMESELILLMEGITLVGVADYLNLSVLIGTNKSPKGLLKI